MKELLPTFFTTLATLCTILIISQLIRLSDVIVTFGFSAENILLPMVYIILPFLPMLMPIAFIFSVMTATSRLSADGELTAMFAAGLSFYKLAMPFLWVAAVLYAFSAICGIHFEGWGRRQFQSFIFQKTKTELDSLIRFKIQAGSFSRNFIDYTFYCEKISADRIHYENVMLAPHSIDQKQNYLIVAPRATIQGTVATGDLHMTLFNGTSYAYNPQNIEMSISRFERTDIDLIWLFQQRLLGEESFRDDYRGYTASELNDWLDKLAANPERDEVVYRKGRYLWHARIAQPFFMFAFAFLGIILGIQRQRHQKGSSYARTIGLIIATFVLNVAFRWMAERGYVHVYAGAWLPQFLILFLGLWAYWRKNSLPISESVFVRG